MTTTSAPGSGPPMPDAPIREGEKRQAQIQGETRALTGALDAMLDEYARNNLAGQDVAILSDHVESVVDIAAIAPVPRRLRR